MRLVAKGALAVATLLAALSLVGVFAALVEGYWQRVLTMLCFFLLFTAAAYGMRRRLAEPAES